MNCASSWSLTRSYIEMHGQQNIKNMGSFVRCTIERVHVNRL